MNRLETGRSLWASSIIVFFLGVAVALLYQKPPTLGDDIEYWGLALDLHQGVPGAWKSDSFHDLRWPVWGMCWVLQALFGFSSWSYYLEPAVYLGGGALLIFHLALKAGLPQGLRWAAVILFLFHPLLDPSLGRPMPDLSEGFWVAAAFFLWLSLMEAKGRGMQIFLCALTGLALAVAQANRITGVFAIPVIALGTLVLYPRKFGWLLLCGFFAGLFVAIEWAIYHRLTGDWLHALHANLGARGRKGTENIPLWELPFRFLPLLWRSPQDIIFSILATFGLLLSFWKGNKAGRAVALYAVVYYLTYNCALQSFSPPRPLVRDGERFLASLAFPLAILSAVGLRGIGFLLWNIPPFKPLVNFAVRRWPVALVVLAGAAALISSRDEVEKDYLPQIRDYVTSTPDGTRIFSHDIMRYVATMAAPSKAASLQWQLNSDIIDPAPQDLAAVEQSDQIWLIRKHAWVRNRKRSEMGKAEELAQLASYLTPPLSGWAVAQAGLKGNVPDFLFLQRREGAAEDRSAEEFLASFLSTDLPWKWERSGKNEVIQKRWEQVPVPQHLRGRKIFLWFKYASDRTEPIRVKVDFLRGSEIVAPLLFKPYFFPESSPDFFAIEIPADAEAMNIVLRIEPRTSWIRLDAWRALTFQP